MGAREGNPLTKYTRRLSKALRVLTQRGAVARATDDASNVVWRLRRAEMANGLAKP